MTVSNIGKTTVSVLHDAQLLLNSPKQNRSVVASVSTDNFRAVPIR